MDKRVQIMQLQRVRRLLLTQQKRMLAIYKQQQLAPKKYAPLDRINDKLELVENKLLGLGVDLYGNSVIPLF